MDLYIAPYRHFHQSVRKFLGNKNYAVDMNIYHDFICNEAKIKIKTKAALKLHTLSINHALRGNTMVQFYNRCADSCSFLQF